MTAGGIAAHRTEISLLWLDEYGVMVGIITINDLVEQLASLPGRRDFQDEHRGSG